MESKIKEAEDWYDKNKDIYKSFSFEIAEIIEKVLKTKNISYQSITQRLKEKDSYLNKCKKECYLNPIEEIMDVAGIRIIAYTNNDVKKICEVIKQEFKIDDNNSGNKIDKMDEDKVGYLSVHFIAELNDSRAGLTENSIYNNCKCEIQVRTLLQHAWAEIEHDRHYKFSGVLPKDISRRFYLIAGVLEMMDREFDALSNEIDDYSEIVQTKTKKSDFDIEIDTESLSQYMLSKFKDNVYIMSNEVHKGVIEELIRFGFTKIQDVDEAMTEKNIYTILSSWHHTTFVGILRNLMMLIDAEKYFEVAYNKAWARINENELENLERMGIKNIREYIQAANIEIDNLN